MSSTIAMSPPAEKPLPAPRRIATRVSASRSTSTHTRAISACARAVATASLPSSPITISRMPGSSRRIFRSWYAE
jgi:hypothetical protein